MIKTKNELKKYLEQDRIALGIRNLSVKGRLKNIIFPNHIYCFQKAFLLLMFCYPLYKL